MLTTLLLALAVHASEPASPLEGAWVGACTGIISARPGVDVVGDPPVLRYDAVEATLDIGATGAALRLAEVVAGVTAPSDRVITLEGAPGRDGATLRTVGAPTEMALTRAGDGLVGRVTSPRGDGAIVCTFERG